MKKSFAARPTGVMPTYEYTTKFANVKTKIAHIGKKVAAHIFKLFSTTR